MVFSFSSIVNYRQQCNCWKNVHQRIVDNSFVGQIRRVRRIRHGMRRYISDTQPFFAWRVIMARYTLKRPVCAITSWKPNVSSSTSGKAGRRSLQFATRRRCSDDAPRRESAFARHPGWFASHRGTAGWRLSYQSDLSPRKRRYWQRLHLQHRWSQVLRGWLLPLVQKHHTE